MNTNMTSQKMEILKQKWVEHKDEIMKDEQRNVLWAQQVQRRIPQEQANIAVWARKLHGLGTWRTEATEASQAWFRTREPSGDLQVILHKVPGASRMLVLELTVMFQKKLQKYLNNAICLYIYIYIYTHIYISYIFNVI